MWTERVDPEYREPITLPDADLMREIAQDLVFYDSGSDLYMDGSGGWSSGGEDSG